MGRFKTIVFQSVSRLFVIFSAPFASQLSRSFSSCSEHRVERLVMIGRIMKINVREVDMKIRSLHAQYHDEFQKLEMKKISSQTDESKVSAWEYFDALKFLSNSGMSCSNTIPKSVSETN